MAVAKHKKKHNVGSYEYFVEQRCSESEEYKEGFEEGMAYVQSQIHRALRALREVERELKESMDDIPFDNGVRTLGELMAEFEPQETIDEIDRTE